LAYCKGVQISWSFHSQKVLQKNTQGDTVPSVRVSTCLLDCKIPECCILVYFSQIQSVALSLRELWVFWGVFLVILHLTKCLLHSTVQSELIHEQYQAVWMG
jgi:hypothetical protein